MTEESQIHAVLPTYPYEGALYWMFEETRSNPQRQLNQLYYRGLYGMWATKKEFRARAAAAMCLFDDVVFAGADSLVPNGVQNESVRAYEVCNDRNDWRECRDKIVKALSNTAMTNAFVAKHREVISGASNFELFASRALLHLQVAEDVGATILAGSMFVEFCALLDACVPALGDIADQVPAFPADRILDPEFLDVYGINFSPADLSAFVSVRADKEIQAYAHRFCSTLLQVTNLIEREREFVQAICTAIDHEAISKKAAGVLETTATVCGVAGLIPVLGLVPGIAGLAADAGARSAKLTEKRAGWFLVGPRMQEVAMKDFLRRKANLGGKS